MVITTNGLNLIASEVLNTFDGVTYMAFGTDNIIPTSGDTSLSSEAARLILDSATQGTTDYVFAARVPLGTATATLTKLGLFDAASSGNLSSAKEFPSSVVKSADDELIIGYKITSNVTNI